MVQISNQKRFYIYGYKPGSRSAKALATALGGRVLRHTGGTFHGPNSRRIVINWGSGNCPWSALNGNNYVNIARNKLDFFQYIIGPESPSVNPPRLPEFTTSRTEAQEWLSAGAVVVCRGTLTGHSGAGITLVGGDHGGSLPQVPLYVKYIPKDAEYRVHVFNYQNGPEVVDVQRKVRDPSREPSNWQVRSHQNGFIFIRNDSSGASYKDTAPPDVLEQAKRALACSGLQFGAVDVIWNAHDGQAYVLEINTAPGLEGHTITVYANAIRNYYQVS